MDRCTECKTPFKIPFQTCTLAYLSQHSLKAFETQNVSFQFKIQLCKNLGKHFGLKSSAVKQSKLVSAIVAFVFCNLHFFYMYRCLLWVGFSLWLKKIPSLRPCLWVGRKCFLRHWNSTDYIPGTLPNPSTTPLRIRACYPLTITLQASAADPQSVFCDSIGCHERGHRSSISTVVFHWLPWDRLQILRMIDGLHSDTSVFCSGAIVTTSMFLHLRKATHGSRTMKPGHMSLWPDRWNKEKQCCWVCERSTVKQRNLIVYTETEEGQRNCVPQ